MRLSLTVIPGVQQAQEARPRCEPTVWPAACQYCKGIDGLLAAGELTGRPLTESFPGLLGGKSPDKLHCHGERFPFGAIPDERERTRSIVRGNVVKG